METRANHVLVGLFVLLLGAGALGFAIWIAALQADRQRDSYLLLFDGSVTGLSTGSSVNYEGVPVGEVLSINLDAEDPGRVRVVIDIDSATPVRADTTAVLELAGLTGGRYVQLSGGSPAAPRPSAEEGETLPRLPTRPSQIEQVLAGAPDVVTALNNLLLRAEAILSERNAQRVEMILEESAATMANLSDSSAVLADLARDVRTETGEVLPQLQRTLHSVEQLAAGLEQAGREAGPTVVQIRRSAVSVERLAANLSEVVDENRRPLGDFTTTGLGELSSLLQELRRLTGSLNQITQEVERNPAGFLLGVPPQGYRPSDD